MLKVFGRNVPKMRKKHLNAQKFGSTAKVTNSQIMHSTYFTIMVPVSPHGVRLFIRRDQIYRLPGLPPKLMRNGQEIRGCQICCLQRPHPVDKWARSNVSGNTACLAIIWKMGKNYLRRINVPKYLSLLASPSNKTSTKNHITVTRKHI